MPFLLTPGASACIIMATDMVAKIYMSFVSARPARSHRTTIIQWLPELKTT